MSALNPVWGGDVPAGRRYSPARARSEFNQEQARRYYNQVEQTLIDVTEFVNFLTDAEGHISARTLSAFWNGEQRAQVTIRSLGRLLDRDLVADLQAVEETLDYAAPYPLTDFNETVAPHLFSLIDAIAPSEEAISDGRDGAEQYHYACELRTVLLQHVLGVINERYQVPKFQNLLEASQWIEAFSSILQEAEEVIDETQQLLRCQALAVQSYLDRQRRRLERFEHEARAGDVLVRQLEWREQLALAEKHVINFLAERAEEIERVTFERLAARPGVLEMLAVHTVRRVPKLGLLLFGLATAATGAVGFRATGWSLPDGSLPGLPTPTRGQASEQDTARHAALGRQATTFGVLARQYVEEIAPRSGGLGAGVQGCRGAMGEMCSPSHPCSPAPLLKQSAHPRTLAPPLPCSKPGSRAADAVSRFFNELSGTKGRQELTIKDASTLERVLSELERFGYPKDQVLALLDLPSAAVLREPISLGVRMSQGGRLLLFPPQRTLEASSIPILQPAHVVQRGDTLSAIARAFGISLNTLLASNPQFTNPDASEIGETVIIPGPAWAEAQRNQPLIRWGDRLDRIAGLLGVAPETLASLNNIAKPDQWIYDGGPLVIPADVVAPERAEKLLASQARQGGAAAADQEETEEAPALEVLAVSLSQGRTPPPTLRPIPSQAQDQSFVPQDDIAQGKLRPGQVWGGPEGGALASDEVFRVHVTRPGDSLVSLAEAFDTTVRQIMEDNRLSDDQLTAGQTLLIRGPRYWSAPDPSPAPPKLGGERGGMLNATAAGRTEEVSGGAVDAGLRLMAPLDSPDVASEGGFGPPANGHIELPAASASGFGVPDGTDSPFSSPNPSTHSFASSGSGSGQASLRASLGRAGGGAPPAPVAARAAVDGAVLVARYGGQTWPSLEAMPEEVRTYFLSTLEAVADFFHVRPGDIAAILRAEQNNTGWTLHEPGVSAAGATGVAQVVARTWNGWSNPQSERHSRSLAEIERYGGLGFDWAARAQWRAWQQGRLPLSALEATDADPNVFENGVAAVARHLVHWGLTREAFARDPAAFERRLADAVAVYNSGQPLAVSRDFIQSAANRKTVGDYVAEVLATATAWEANQSRPEATATPASPELAKEKPTLLGGGAEGQGCGGEGVTRRGGDKVTSSLASLSPCPFVPLSQKAPEPLSVVLTTMAVGGGEEPLAVTLQAPRATRDAAGLRPGGPEARRGLRFRAYPLEPMPRVVKPFGAPAPYQIGGRHTGIDVAGPDGATLYAVADGVVTYVGPLYCDAVRACRGDHAVMIEVAPEIYVIYSHNSAALVTPGERVTAGQPVARQGNEGYSFGSHLHFEVHVGAPFSGNWRVPFKGGKFVDPMSFYQD